MLIVDIIYNLIFQMIIVYAIIIVIIIYLFFTRMEKLEPNKKLMLDDKVDVDIRAFIGSWVYKSPDGSHEEYLNIAAGDHKRLLSIRRLNKWRYVFQPVNGGPVTYGQYRKSIEEPPLFRVIPLSPTKIQIVSINPTYVFPATNIDYIETREGVAIKFQGKLYHESGVTF